MIQSPADLEDPLSCSVPSHRIFSLPPLVLSLSLSLIFCVQFNKFLDKDALVQEKVKAYESVLTH